MGNVLMESSSIISLRRITEANYKNLATKSSYIVYLCTDTGNIYLGNKLYTGKLQFSKPQVGEVGILYIVDNLTYVWDGTQYIQLTKESVSTIDGTNPSDSKVASEKSIVDYVKSKIDTLLSDYLEVIPPNFEVDFETNQLMQTSDGQRIEFKYDEATTELSYRILPVSSSITT